MAKREEPGRTKKGWKTLVLGKSFALNPLNFQMEIQHPKESVTVHGQKYGNPI